MSRGVALLEMTRMRVVLFLREPEAMFWVFGFPIILAVVLGWAFKNKGIESADVGVVRVAGEEWVLEALQDVPHIDAESFSAADRDRADKKLRSGKISVLVIPRAGEPPELIFDPQRPEANVTRLRVVNALQHAAGRTEAVALVHREVTETGSRYIDWLIPGLLGMNLMGTGLWGTAFGLVTTRQRKLLKRYLVTPMNRGDYLLSFVLGRMLFLAVEVMIILGFAWAFLGLPMRGSILALFLLCFIGGMSFAGLGILIGSRATTLEGVNGILNFVMMPMWLCSGIFFSYEKFPDWVHPIVQVLPLTSLIDALREVILEGGGLAVAAVPLLIQVAWGSVCFLVAVKIFRWE